MNNAKMINSIQEHSIIDLFNAIDNISNSPNTNDKIISMIKSKITSLFITHLRKKEFQKQKKALLHQYKDSLISFSKLIEKQVTIIDNFLDDDPDNEIKLFFELRKELLYYYMQIYQLDLFHISIILNEKERKIYHYIHLYDFLESFQTTAKELCSQQNAEPNESGESSFGSDWKTYYYLIMYLEKQRDFNQAFFSYYKAKSQQLSDPEFYLNTSKFFAADFQGQLSKSIYCQRKRLKLTQKQLQARSGIGHTMIAKIEKVKQPTTLETAIKLLSSLNMGIALYPIIEPIEPPSNPYLKGELND